MDDKCVLCATLICTYVCVWCAYAYVCSYVLCVCIVCQCSCMDMCIGLRLMSSVILNFFMCSLSWGSLSQTLGSPIHLILLDSLFWWFTISSFLFGIICMMLAYPALMWFLRNPDSSPHTCQANAWLLSRLCSPCLLIAMSLVGKRPPTFFPSLWCLQVNQPTCLSSDNPIGH